MNDIQITSASASPTPTSPQHEVHPYPTVLKLWPNLTGVLPEVIADRLLQGQTAIHHLEVAGPPSRRVMIHKGNSVVVSGRGGGQRGRGRRCRFFILYIFTFLFMRWKSNEAKGISNLSII